VSLELLNLHTPEGRELGYLAVRLATVHAEITSNPVALGRSLERRIDVIVKRTTRQHEQQDTEHQRKTELKPLTAEQAKLRTELLKLEMSL
jgi:hypothetical protein